MALEPTSRYAGLPGIEVERRRRGPADARGAPRRAPSPRTRGATRSRAGDRLDLLGPRSPTGDSTRWWGSPTRTPGPTPTAARRARAARSSCPMPDTRLLVEIDGAALAPDDALAVLNRGRRSRRPIDERRRRDAGAAARGRRTTASGRACWTRCSSPLTPRSGPGVSPATSTTASTASQTEAEWRIDPEGARELTVKAVDRTLELDLEEKVVAWPGSSDSAIAEAIFAALRPRGRGRADARRARPGRARRPAARRATSRSCARSPTKWGYDVFLEADGAAASPATSGPPTRSPSPRARLSLGFGGERGGRGRRASSRPAGACGPPASRALRQPAKQADGAGDDQAPGRPLRSPGSTTRAPRPGRRRRRARPDRGRPGRSPAEPRSPPGSRRARHRPRRADAARPQARPRAAGSARPLGPLPRASACATRSRQKRHRQQVTLVRNALGLTGDEPFGAPGAGGLA